MRVTTSIAAALAVAAPLAAADKQSKPFHLVAVSDNSTINGTTFYSCHEGAGIESLCVGKKDLSKADTYRLNTTAGVANSGSLNWLLKGSNFQEWSAMSLYVDPSTNVALPIIGQSDDYTPVGFDSDNKMYIQSALDDTKSPAKFTKGTKLYRWEVCQTYYVSYLYQTLAWVQGEGKPQNPTCESVEVKRVFA